VLTASADLAVRAASSHFPPVLEWHDWETQNKIIAIERLAASGGASVVSVGSSMVNAGVDPVLLTRLDGDHRPAFNAALNGSDIRLTELWTLRVVVPLLHPRVVVVGLNLAELNANAISTRKFYNGFIHSVGWRRMSGTGSLWQKIEDRADSISALVHNRALLRQPSEIFRPPHQIEANAVNRFGVLRALRIFDHAVYAVTAKFRHLDTYEVLNDYTLGQDRLDALARLINGLHAQGIGVVLVRMPITSDEIAMLPHGRQDFDAFDRTWRAFVAAHPVTYLDTMPRFTDTAYFRDPHHVNGTGKHRLTEMIAPLVKGLL